MREPRFQPHAVVILVGLTIVLVALLLLGASYLVGMVFFTPSAELTASDMMQRNGSAYLMLLGAMLLFVGSVGTFTGLVLWLTQRAQRRR